MRYSQNLGLTLPEGPDYFNIDDWNSNMNKLDYAYSMLKEGSVVTEVDASLIHYDGSQTGLIPNIQGALEQLENNEIEEETIQEYTIDQETYILIKEEGHDYVILHFGEDVYDVYFNILGSENVVTWEKRKPIWHPNSTFELSFLNGDCVWIEY
jgi:hypothetical protein